MSLLPIAGQMAHCSPLSIISSARMCAHRNEFSGKVGMIVGIRLESRHSGGMSAWMTTRFFFLIYILSRLLQDFVAWWTRGMESSCATVQTLHTKRLSCMAMFCEKKNQHKQNKKTRIWFPWRWSRASTASATMNKSSWLPNVFAIDWRGCEIEIIYHGQKEPCSAQRYAFTFCEYIVVVSHVHWLDYRPSITRVTLTCAMYVVVYTCHCIARGYNCGVKQ